MKINLPYTLRLLFPVIGWGALCGAFSYVLILTIAPFAQEGTRQAFYLTAPIYFLVLAVLSLMRYGGIGFLSGEDIILINKNVGKKGIDRDIDTEDIKRTFHSLVYLCRTTLVNVVASGLSVMVLTVSTAWITSGSWLDIGIIILGGFISLFFFSSFATFFCQMMMFDVIKDCRRILIEREEEVENVELSGIGMKFFFLFFFPLFTVLIVLLCVKPITLNLIVLSLSGLLMTFIINRILYVYISNLFKEIEGFTKELPKGGMAVFATGSLDREFVNLANSMSKASENIYHSRKESEESKKEMEKRVQELEKFFDLTVNREIKMVELKKEIKNFKNEENIQEDNA
jgi:hypothetical protein